MVWVMIIGILAFVLYFYMSYLEQQPENDNPDIAERVIKDNNIVVSKRYDFKPSSTTIISDEQNKNIWHIWYDEIKCIPYSDILEVLFYEGKECTKEMKVPGIYGDNEETFLKSGILSDSVDSIEIELHIKEHAAEFDFDYDYLCFKLKTFPQKVQKTNYLYEIAYKEALDCYQLFESIVNQNEKVCKSNVSGQK